MTRLPLRSSAVRRAVTLLELMIALAIVGSLLAATGLALASSFEAYAINTEQSSVVQNARVAMNRVVRAIRTSAVHSPDGAAHASQFAAGATVIAPGVALFDEDGHDLIFRHDVAGKRLLAIVDGREYVLAHGVDLFAVTMEPMKSDDSLRRGGPWDLMRRASVRLTMHNGAKNRTTTEANRNQSVTLTSAVTPRRNNW